MKLSDLIKMQDEMIALLHNRATEGSNEAAKLLLDYLRDVSKDIEEWKKSQPIQK